MLRLDCPPYKEQCVLSALSLGPTDVLWEPLTETKKARKQVTSKIATSPLMDLLEGPGFLPVTISTRDLIRQKTPGNVWTCGLDL